MIGYNVILDILLLGLLVVFSYSLVAEAQKIYKEFYRPAINDMIDEQIFSKIWEFIICGGADSSLYEKSIEDPYMPIQFRDLDMDIYNVMDLQMKVEDHYDINFKNFPFDEKCETCTIQEFTKLTENLIKSRKNLKIYKKN